MNRRDILGLGALAAGASAGIPGCSVPRMVAEMRGPSGAAEFNALLDAELAKLAKPGLLQRIAAEQGRKPRADDAALAEKDATFRRMLSAILISQTFRELPEETQQHPDVQARMWKHIDEISGTVYEVSDMLAALDADQRAALRSHVREQPELAMDVGEALDARAARAGLSSARRRQLRQMMSATTFRLKTANPSSIIDEYVDKVEKLRETSARDARALDNATELHEREFWRQQRLRLADDPGAPRPGANGPLMPPPSSGAPVPPPPPTPDGEVQVTPNNPYPQQPVVDALGAVRMLTRLARRAAFRGHCDAVEAIGRRVQEIHPEYHARVFATDKVLVGCRPGVVRPDPEIKAAQDEAAKEQPHAGDKGLRTGGYMLGLGVLVSVLSIPLIYAVIGLFTLTAGVILMGLGLLWLYFSALVYVGQDP